ncbi:hypothetical protein ACFLUJ_08790, partial [Chloroflexota bacterium]
MSRETEEERSFSEDVDRLLAGEDIKLDENTSEEYQRSVNFARKLTELSLHPSPQYREQLKQRLLLELTKQEAESQQKEQGNWFKQGLRGLIPQSVIWRSVATTSVVVVLAMVLLWRMGTFTQSPVLTTVEMVAAAEMEMATAEEAMEEASALSDTPETAIPALGKGGEIGDGPPILLELSDVPLG